MDVDLTKEDNSFNVGINKSATEEQLNDAVSSASLSASNADDSATSAAESESNLANKVDSDITGVTGADVISNIISLTSTEYGVITPDSSTLYIVTDTGNIYLGTITIL